MKTAQSKWNAKNREKMRAYYKKWAATNREKVLKAQKAHYKRTKSKYQERHLMKKYGITLKDFQEMLTQQNNACAICMTSLNNPHVDHCHVSGKIRALLCKHCNSMLGMAKDNPNTLIAGVNYLEKYK